MRKCRSTVRVSSPAGVHYLSAVEVLQDHRVLCYFFLSTQLPFSLLLSQGSVFIICRWQVKGTLMLAPCVYKRLCFLLSGTHKRRAVIPCQGKVGSNAFPQAIAKTGIIYCCQCAFRISSHLQPLKE